MKVTPIKSVQTLSGGFFSESKEIHLRKKLLFHSTFYLFFLVWVWETRQLRKSVQLGWYWMYLKAMYLCAHLLVLWREKLKYQLADMFFISIFYYFMKRTSAKLYYIFYILLKALHTYIFNPEKIQVTWTILKMNVCLKKDFCLTKLQNKVYQYLSSHRNWCLLNYRKSTPK